MNLKQYRDETRIAAWLIDNSSLTFDQIADYCGINILDIRRLADSATPFQIKPLDPIEQGLLTRRDVDRAQSDENYRLPRSPAQEARIEFDPVTFGSLCSERDKFHTSGTTVAYHVYYGRNAWHSTWFSGYYRRGTINATLKHAQNQVERWRVQGSVFRIEETPAIYFRSKDRSFLIAEINTQNSFHSLAAVLAEFKTGDELDNLDFNLRADTLICLCFLKDVAFTDYNPLVREHQLKGYTSYPRGGDYELGWRTGPARRSDWKGAELALLQLNRLLLRVEMTGF